MPNKALVIQENHHQAFDDDAFMQARNLKAEYCSSRVDALHAIQSNRYRCVVVSMDMQKENPLEIIGALRDAEADSGLSPMLIIVVGRDCQLTQSEIGRLNISAQIRSHHLR
jgi:ActR/RegA family two-component response regulator